MPERTDLSLRGLAAGAGLVLAGIAASLLAAAFVTSRVDAPASGASAAAPPPPIAGPVLETAPSQHLAAFLREKNARLESRGPIAGDPGHVHIPIEEAMRILATKNHK